MSNPEIQAALDSIGFVEDTTQTFVESIQSNFFDEESIQNFPNPFNNETEIEFKVIEPGVYKISVFNVLGEEIQIITSQYFERGSYKLKWSPDKNLTSSIYFIVANSEKKYLIRKALLLK
jgi:hypothetical protein